MKKFTLLSFVVVLLSFTSQAQITKGSVLLGGSIGGSYQKNEGPNQNGYQKNKSFSIAPSVGLSVQDNKVIGLRLAYGKSQGYFGGSLDSTISNNYAAGIFYRRYFTLGKSFYLFAEGLAQYYQSSQDTKDRSGVEYYNSSQKGVGLLLTPGIAYAASKKFHLELSLNNLLNVSYSKSKWKNLQYSPAENESSNFDFGVNLNPSSTIAVGFRFVIGK